MAIRHDTTEPRSALWDNDHVGDLDDLDDVTVPSPTLNDILQWNGSAWVNVATSTIATSSGRRVVMRPGITSPPEPVSNVDGDGWVYMEV